jgi:hypothetical protein
MDLETIGVLVFMAVVALWYAKSELDQLKNLISNSG